ncbi:MAG: extracellular solute-binding protein [Aggregatilineales bacterium]
MNRFFRTLAMALLAAAAALSVVPAASAQGSYVKTFDLPKTPATSGAYKGVDPTGAQITMWHVYTGGTKDAFDKLVAQFNQSNPWKITLTATAKGSYNTLYQAILAAIQTKTLPDISIAYQNQASDYQSANVILNLGPLVDDAVYGLGDAGKADFIPGILNADLNPQYNGARLGFPLYRSMEVLFYNVDALKKLGYDAPPKTWDDFKTISCKYFKATGNVAYEVRTDASWVAAATYAQGGDIYDAKTGKFTYDSPAAEIGPQTMQDLINQGCAGLIANPSGFSDQNDFGAGKTLFYGGSTSGLFFVQKAITNAKQSFTFSVAPLPYTDHPVMDLYGASWSALQSGDQAKDLASWLFIRWFSEAEQQSAWAAASSYFPVRKSASALMTDFLAKNAAYKAGLNLLVDTKAEPPFGGYQAVRDDASNAFNDILDGANVKQRFSQLDTKADQDLAGYKPNLTPATPKPPAPATAAPTVAATKSS